MRQFVSSRHAMCVFYSRRCKHMDCRANRVDDRTEKSDPAAAASSSSLPSDTKRGGLESREWLHLHPVEKWTILLDLGRRAPLLLERASANPKEQSNGIMARLVSRVIQRRQPLASEALHFSCGTLVQASQERVDIHRRLVQELPYCVRLKLSLSFLMWVRSLRDVQDTIARLRLPYAATRRVQLSAVADVFPTRLAEWSIDPFTTVSVQMDATLNGSAEQVPAPHAWRPDEATENEGRKKGKEKGNEKKWRDASIRWQPIDSNDNEGINLFLGSGSASGQHRQRKRSLHNQMNVLREVQEMKARPSDDDQLAARVTKRTYRSLQKTPSTRATGPAVLSSHFSSWAVNDALRGAIPSPLALDHEEDELYHHNFLRGEGCPLDQNGRLMRTPIHIAVPPVTDAAAMAQYFVMAHAAILSSLFVEGRTVHFTTDHSLLLEYVMFLFEELIEDCWISASLCKGIRHYIPPWSIAERVFVVMPPAEGRVFSTCELRDAACLILESTPCCVIIESPPRDQPHYYGKDLVEEVERQQAEVETPERKSLWRVSWVPVSSSNTFVAASAALDSKANPGLSEFQCAVNEILRQFHTVTFLYTPSNCRFTPRQAQEWWWKGLPPSVHVVSVNSHALDLLYYFPQAPFLRKKIGNAFRYRAVRRVLIGKNIYGGREDHIRRWVHRWCCWRRLSRRGLNSHMAIGDKVRVLLNNDNRSADDDKAVDALKWERTVDYLANPTKGTWFALMVAKLFHI